MEQKKVMEGESVNIAKKKCLSNMLKQIGLILIVGSIYLAFVLKTEQGIPCIFYRITGLKCPGCGMTHAMIEIWKGNYKAALQYNALSLTIFPLVCLYLLYRFIHTELNKKEGFHIWEYAVLVVLLFITIGYAWLRNLI